VIASVPDRRALAAAALAVIATACASGAAVPDETLVAPALHHAAYVPDDTDRAARDLAAAALGSDPARAHAELTAFDATERARREAGEPPTGLAGYAQHVVDATNDDALAYRHASAALLERDDLDPALRKQVEMEIEDDPLRLADRRIREGRLARFGRDVNTITSAVGRSLFTTIFAPIRLAQAVVSVAVQEHLDDPISLQERQALAHWKDYVEAHPETPEAHKLVARIEKMNAAWFDTKRRNSARAAKSALENGQPDLAVMLSERALRYAPDDHEARRLRDTAEERMDAERERRASTLAVSDAVVLDAGDTRQRDLLLAMFARGDVTAASDAVLAEKPALPVARAARFARATAEGEAGHEAAMWNEFAEIASKDADAPPASRQAEILLHAPDQNPWQAFQDARKANLENNAALLAFGPLAHGARDRDLPRTVEWLLEAPTLVPVLGGIPWRLVQMGVAPPQSKAPAVAAERYLDRFPNGVHADELRRWLIDYDVKNKRFARAHALALETPGFDPKERDELAEKAAKQALEQADKPKLRRDVRIAMLEQAADRYPDTESGRKAGAQVREEIENASEQRVRISRGFLQENPKVAGPDGLGLRRELLDGDVHNGELHPLGVTLLGGHALEIALIADGKRDKDDPVKVRETISAEQLARLVSLLEETSLRNALLDPMAAQDDDAQRETFFERARLGAAATVDPRATASSSFAFVGVRERYNIVRSRESILPVEIVISGSFPDLGLGAYPRIRMPRETPDAVLYK
jgi:tetratricopeptide (TPR) repeat protein